MILITSKAGKHKRRTEIMSMNIAENIDGTFDIMALDRSKNRWLHIENVTDMELIGEE